jgi:hypothetical protein
MENKEQETNRVFDDFQDALSSEQLATALRSIKKYLEIEDTPKEAKYD